MVLKALKCLKNQGFLLFHTLHKVLYHKEIIKSIYSKGKLNKIKDILIFFKNLREDNLTFFEEKDILKIWNFTNIKTTLQLNIATRILRTK